MRLLYRDKGSAACDRRIPANVTSTQSFVADDRRHHCGPMIDRMLERTVFQAEAFGFSPSK
jgi:hypothetical protein